MGQARQKKLEVKSQITQLEAASDRVSSALRRLATASSASFGRDCYLHADLGRQLLADLGFATRLVLGFCAWRVGEGDGDVISHAPHTPGYIPAGVKGLAYHAWLECSGLIVDFTTYQLKHKAQELDAFDGHRTTVTWSPPFLLLPRYKIQSHREVAAARRPVATYYAARSDLEEHLLPQSDLDPEDLAIARFLVANPDVGLFGRNDIRRILRSTESHCQ